MPKFKEINLGRIIEIIGEEEVKKILSCFSCPLNKDIEDFIKFKAIEFSKQGLAKTTLVYWQSDDETEKYLVGYYTLASKYICLSRDSLSKTLAKKMQKFSASPPSNGVYEIPTPLIAQLGKNYTEGNDRLIYGDDLLQLALDKVKLIQNEIGGRYVYLESEDKPALVNFYQRNGFQLFGKRTRDRDESGIDGDYLLQWLLYFKN